MMQQTQRQTYIFGGESRRNAQGEQGERRPLEVDHCAGFRGERGVMMMKRKKDEKMGVLAKDPDPNCSLEESMS